MANDNFPCALAGPLSTFLLTACYFLVNVYHFLSRPRCKCSGFRGRDLRRLSSFRDSLRTGSLSRRPTRISSIATITSNAATSKHLVPNERETATGHLLVKDIPDHARYSSACGQIPQSTLLIGEEINRSRYTSSFFSSFDLGVGFSDRIPDHLFPRVDHSLELSWQSVEDNNNAASLPELVSFLQDRCKLFFLLIISLRFVLIRRHMILYQWLSRRRHIL